MGRIRNRSVSSSVGTSNSSGKNVTGNTSNKSQTRLSLFRQDEAGWRHQLTRASRKTTTSLPESAGESSVNLIHYQYLSSSSHTRTVSGLFVLLVPQVVSCLQSKRRS